MPSVSFGTSREVEMKTGFQRIVRALMLERPEEVVRSFTTWPRRPTARS